MSRESIVSRLREGDRKLQAERMPESVDRRILARLREPERSSRRGLQLSLAAVAVAGILIAVVVLGREKPVSTVAGFRCAAACESFRSEERVVTSLADDAVLYQPGHRLALAKGARVTRQGNEARLLSGEMTVIADAAGVSSAVWISDGRVQFQSARFSIAQVETRGELIVEEGFVDYRPLSGPPRRLAAGETLAWPEKPGEESSGETMEVDVGSPIEPDAGADTPKGDGLDTVGEVQKARPRGSRTEDTPEDKSSKGAKPASENIEVVFEEVARLRAQSRYDQAVARLRRELKATTNTVDARRLSFEIGSILTYNLPVTERACKHWSAHKRRFGTGSYGPAIERALRRLGCAADE